MQRSQELFILNIDICSMRYEESDGQRKVLFEKQIILKVLLDDVWLI